MNKNNIPFAMLVMMHTYVVVLLGEMRAYSFLFYHNSLPCLARSDLLFLRRQDGTADHAPAAWLG